MKHRSILLVTSDLGESDVLAELAVRLRARNERVTTLLGKGTTPSPFTREEVADCAARHDAVVVATSDNNDLEVVASQVACARGKPLVFLSLGRRSYQKKSFAHILSCCSLVIVSNDDDRVAAESVLGSHRVAMVPIPTLAEHFNPRYDRREVRSTMHLGDPSERLVLVALDKMLSVNMTIGVAALEALRTSRLKRSTIVVAIHPGHTSLASTHAGEKLVAMYEREFKEYAPWANVHVSLGTHPFGIGAPNMLPGVDLVVGTNTTVLIQAACLRIPAIAVLLSGAFKGVTLPDEREGWWPPCDDGGVVPVYDIDVAHLRSLLETLTDRDTAFAKELVLRQKRAFPEPLTREDPYLPIAELIRDRISLM